MNVTFSGKTSKTFHENDSQFVKSFFHGPGASKKGEMMM